MSTWGVAEPVGPLAGYDSPSTPPLALTTSPQFPHSGRSTALAPAGKRREAGRRQVPEL